jgi:hypothetical protein
MNAGHWENTGTYPPSSANYLQPATAGASRAYYHHTGTGVYCWRHASWGQHGTGVHGFRAYGTGHGCDADGNPDGQTYPASEF